MAEFLPPLKEAVSKYINNGDTVAMEASLI